MQAQEKVGMVPLGERHPIRQVKQSRSLAARQKNLPAIGGEQLFHRRAQSSVSSFS